MLIVTRKVSESIKIGDDIWIKITKVSASGDPRVKVGIIAPEGVRILRTELLPVVEIPPFPGETRQIVEESTGVHRRCPVRPLDGPTDLSEQEATGDTEEKL